MNESTQPSQTSFMVKPKWLMLYLSVKKIKPSCNVRAEKGLNAGWLCEGLDRDRQTFFSLLRWTTQMA